MQLYRHVPNMLTLARFPCGFGFGYFHFTGRPWVGFALATLGCLTDWFDGYLARRWRVESAFGKVADAYADKWICWILIGVAFSIVGPAVVLIGITIVIGIYDVGLSYLRFVLHHIHIPVSWYAKAKTTMLMAGLLLIYVGWMLGGKYEGGVITLAYLILILAGAFALRSIGEYLRGYKLEWLIPRPIRLLI